jgi:hypothetical protein
MRAIEYISNADAGGYGVAAVGYVRLLVEAGFQVHWMPYPYRALESLRVGQEGIGAGRGPSDRPRKVAPQRGGRREPPLPVVSNVAAGRRPCPHYPRCAGLLAAHLSPMTGVCILVCYLGD